MQSHHRLWIITVICAAFTACARAPEPRHPATETTNSDDSDDSDDSGEPASSGDSKATVKSKDKPAKTAIGEICDQVLRRAEQKCGKKVAALYRSSCLHYQKDPGNCQNQIIEAMKCQHKATDDLFCSHQADPNCSQPNRDLKVCERGAAPEEQTTSEDLTVPPGWEKIRDTQLGFTVAMPPGAELDTKSDRRTWHAEAGGISYYVAALEPPTGTINNQALVRTVIAYVGSRCQIRLKLHGDLEIKGTRVVQYDSACPDGSEWHGMLHFWNGKAVSTGFHAPAGATGVTEPFYYSFQLSK